MAITLIEYKKKRPGTTYNEKKKCYVGYRIDVWVNNIRYRNERFATRDAAEKFINTLKLQNTYKRKGLTLKEDSLIPRVSEVFQKRKLQIINKAEKVRAERVFKEFSDVLGSDLLVTEVRTLHFQKFNNLRIATGVKPETVHRDINTLSPAFKLAPENFPEQLEDWQPPKIPRPKVKKYKRRTRVISEREKNLICDYFRKSQKDDETLKSYENRLRIGRMFEISWLLGMRFKEIAKLKKSDFDFENRVLKVRRYKTDSFTLMEYIPEFICHKIREAVEASATSYIFTISGNYPKDFYQLMREAVESGGMVYGRDHKDGITFHSNRHSFSTRIVQSTDLATAGELTGISTKILLDYYSHATEKSKKEVFEKMYAPTTREFGFSELQEIFDSIKEDKLNFAQFCDLIIGSQNSLLGKNQTQKLRLVK